MYDFLVYRIHYSKGFYSEYGWNFRTYLSHVIFNQSSQRKTKIDHHYITGFKNCFGEVHHNLIRDVVSRHHMKLENLLKTCILTFYMCINIRVHYGVYLFRKGDYISPLLFNLIINSFIQHIKQKNMSNLAPNSANTFRQDIGINS